MTAPIIFTCLGICLGVLADWGASTLRARAGRDDIMAIADTVTAHASDLTRREHDYITGLRSCHLPRDVRDGGRTIADSLRRRTPTVSDVQLCATLITAHSYLAACLEAGDPAPHADGALDMLGCAITDLAAAPLADPTAANR